MDVASVDGVLLRGRRCAGRDDRIVRAPAAADVGALLRIPVPAGVLRPRPGQTVVLTDENGREVLAQVEPAGLGGEGLELVLVRPVGLGQDAPRGKGHRSRRTASRSPTRCPGRATGSSRSADVRSRWPSIYVGIRE